MKTVSKLFYVPSMILLYLSSEIWTYGTMCATPLVEHVTISLVFGGVCFVMATSCLTRGYFKGMDWDVIIRFAVVGVAPFGFFAALIVFFAIMKAISFFYT